MKSGRIGGGLADCLFVCQPFVFRKTECLFVASQKLQNISFFRTSRGDYGEKRPGAHHCLVCSGPFYSVWFLFLLAPFLAELAAQEAVEADGNEGDAEELSLVEPDGVDHLDFPCFLNVFEKLDEEAEGEDGRQAPAEEKSRANAVAVAAVEPQADEEEHEIGNGFV